MVIVVGHGPSLKSAKRGEYIDSFKHVVKFLHIGDWQNAVDYGKRTTYFCATVARHNEMMRKERPEKGYLIWNKRFRHHINQPMKDLVSRYGGCDMSDVVQSWAKKLPQDERQYLSHGTAGIISAASFIGEDVVVVGCDDLKIGRDIGSGYVGSWRYEKRFDFAERCKKGSPHFLSVERELVDEIAEKYNVSITFE